MKERNHKFELDPLELIDGQDGESHFDLAGSVEEVEEEREFKALLDKWQVSASSRSLDQRVLLAYRAQTARRSLWRRMLTASIPLPVPAAAVLAVILVWGATALLRQRPAPAPQAPAIVERTRTVEVPVVQERVVLRVVYRERKRVPAAGTGSLHAPESMSLALASGENSQGYFTDTDLAGFQPNAEMNFKVIKKADKNEK
jgi:hypothetical protein